jgi:hypothetical protein
MKKIKSMLAPKHLTVVLAIVAALMMNDSVQAQRSHPLTYVDKGACPFECCQYGAWTVGKETVLYAKPQRGSQKVGVLKKGSRVRGITGEVHTLKPGRFRIIRAHEQYKPGDILWVYTPSGEGYYSVWYKGKMTSAELTYMSGPYETSYPTCEESKDCWGKLETELKTEWWVKVRSRSGITGWTRQTENFGGMDGCG